MRVVFAIARLSLLEALRSRILAVLAFFVIGVLLASQFFGYLSLGEQAKIFKDLCLGLLSLLISLLAVVLPVEQIQKEKERNSLASLISKPVHRYSYVAGKFLGMLSILLLVTAAISGLIALLMTVRGAAWDSNMLKAAVMVFCQGMILASCAIAIGIGFSSYALSILCGVCVYLAGNLLEPLREWVEQAGQLWAKICALLLLYLLPHLENLNVQDSVALGEGVPWAYVGENAAYSLVYAGVVFILAAMLFNQKDL